MRSMTTLPIQMPSFSLSFMTTILLLLLLSTNPTVFVVTVLAIPYEDEILSLPLVNTTSLPAKQFSGYLNGTNGCDIRINGPYCYIHYWFCLAEYENDNNNNDSNNNNINDSNEEKSNDKNNTPYINDYPVIVWLNGGPGSSSILGLLQELGPLLFNATGTGFMNNNPYSWTKLPANLLILESPIGVGYSYCSRQETYGQLCYNTDTYTASTSRAAIFDFFLNKFPEYRNNPLYITGESYAGVYIPTLAYEIIQYNNQNQQPTDDDTKKMINLVGIAVGDPCTDNTAQHDSMDAIWYSNKYGLMDDQIYNTLYHTCQIRIPISFNNNHPILRLGKIQIPSIVTTLLSNTTSSTTNRYFNRMKYQQTMLHEIQQQIQTYSNSKKRERELSLVRSRPTSTTTSTTTSSIMDDECDLAWKKFLFSSSNGLSQSWEHLYINDYNLYGFVSNDEDNAMAAYMNRLDVRMALHVTNTPHMQQWPYPDAGFDYTKEFNACNEDAMLYNDDDDDDDIDDDGNNDVSEAPKSMIYFYRQIIPHLSSGTIIYNGDTDPCVSYEGTRTAVKRIGINELDGGSYRPWFYNHTATTIDIIQEKAITFGPNLILHNAGIQFGGEIINYEQNLSFITIHGSGHMVPQFRPQAAFHMLSKLVSNHDPNGILLLLSPLLPSNATLRNASDTEFLQLMDEWTIRAKSVPYVG